MGLQGVREGDKNAGSRLDTLSHPDSLHPGPNPKRVTLTFGVLSPVQFHSGLWALQFWRRSKLLDELLMRDRLQYLSVLAQQPTLQVNTSTKGCW